MPKSRLWSAKQAGITRISQAIHGSAQRFIPPIQRLHSHNSTAARRTARFIYRPLVGSGSKALVFDRTQFQPTFRRRFRPPLLFPALGHDLTNHPRRLFLEGELAVW